MQDFQDELGSTGQGAGVILGDRDETRLNHTINLTDGRDNQDVTTFQPAGNAKSYSYLLTSGTASVKGFSAEDPEVVRAQHAEVLGKSRAKPILIVGKYGLAPGTEANFARTLANTRNCERSLTGVTMADASFALDGSGVLDGVSLHAVFGDSAPGQSEVQKLVFTNANPYIFRGLRAVGTTQVFSFDLTATNAALGAGIAALTAYAGRVVTVTGADLTGATFKSGEKRIAFDGAVDVPQLEIVSGAVESLAVSNGVGNYTLNGATAFQLGVTEGALQTNQQNLGGARAGVVVKGASVANTAPGKSQTVSGSGSALSIGGVAVNFATPETPSAYLARINMAVAPRVLSLGTGASIVKGSAGGTSAPLDVTNNGVGNVIGVSNDGIPVSKIFNNDTSDEQALIVNGFAGWDFGLGGTATVNKVRIFPYSAGYPTNSFVFESSPTGDFTGEQTVVYSRPSGTALPSQAWSEFTFPDATGRAFRLVKKDSGISSISEIEFIGLIPPTSANITLIDAANAGNPPDLAIVGTGYASNSVLSNPNGSANFKAYYPLNAAPAAPSATGLNSAVARASAPTDIASATIQQSTGADVSFAYNVVTESSDGDWMDFGINSPSGFHLAVSVIHAQGIGATLGLIVETADADGAGAPVPASIVALHNFAPFGARAYDIVASNTAVKRLVRVRRTVTGTGEFIFALALAPRVA